MFAGDVILLNGQGKDSHLIAVNAKNGETAWTTEGNLFPSDYPVPMVWPQGKMTEVILPCRGGLLAFDLKDGKRRWWIPGLSPEANSSPTIGDGLLFVATHLPGGDPDRRMTLPPFAELLKKHDKNNDGKLSRQEVPNDLVIFQRDGKDGVGEIRLNQMFWLFDKNKDNHIDEAEYNSILKTPYQNSLLAIRPGGDGDISGTHIAFQVKRGAPEVPSPLYYEGRIYMVRNGGILTVIDAKTGKEAYEQTRLSPGGIFYASPVAGDGKVYLASDAGVLIVLKSSDKHEVLSETDLGDTIRATPAIVDGVVYVRSAGHLWAFGK
jgi:outer membrane protein assembly factor BamB